MRSEISFARRLVLLILPHSHMHFVSFISVNRCKCLHSSCTAFPGVNGEGHSEGCVDQLPAGGEI